MTSPLERPADSAGELYYPTDITPEQAFQAIGRLRKAARDEIDRLIRFLDETDNHMELEQNGDEADASYPEGSQRLTGHPNEDDEPSGDESEPSLGSRTNGEHSDQSQWGKGAADDMEDEHDGAEPEDDSEPTEDNEPSLAWPEAYCLGIGGLGYDTDREEGGGYRRPQNRTDLHTTLAVEQSYRKFVHGLTDSQRVAVRQRMHTDSGVILR